MFSPQEVAAMLQDTGGVEVAYTPPAGVAIATWGHLEEAGDTLWEEDSGPVDVRETVVVVATGILSGLLNHGAITVAGSNYTVRDHHRRREGGSLTVIGLHRS